MATLVSTGQITIVDNNDAKPITAYITANTSLQQVYTLEESTESFNPNWVTTPLVLTAKVYVGSVSDVVSQLTNRKWSTDLVTSVGSGTTLTVNTNFLTTASPNRTYYFEGDYTDPATGLTTHVLAQISLNQVQTGSNAVYVIVRGTVAIQEAEGTTKNAVAITADLVRVSGIDTIGITYKWFEGNTNTHISTSISGYATKYGLKTTAAGVTPTGSNAELGVNVPAANMSSTRNTLVIGEAAVQDIAIFRVEVIDAASIIRSAYFTIYDVSDPYDTKINSSTGDKLQNGQGSTVLSPVVYNGSSQVLNLSNWYFYWFLYNKDGNRTAFVDANKTALSGGRSITSNTIGSTALINFSGPAITWATGDLVKVITPSGGERVYEVSTSGAFAAVTIKIPAANTWLNFSTFPAPLATNDLVGGVLFACTAQGKRGTAITGSTGMPSDVVLVANASITVTADDIDTKGRIICESNRP